MPGGRSVVTVHGPSFARFSASARRCFTGSSVQASFRIIALWIGSISFSEINVRGTSAACIQNTTEMDRNAVLTAINCTQTPLPDAALIFGVELATDQGYERQHIHPDHQCDGRPHRPVHHVVVRDVLRVPREPRGRCQPK